MVATLKAKSQVTIPASVVKQAGLKTGDAFDVKYENGNIVLTPMVYVTRKEADSIANTQNWNASFDCVYEEDTDEYIERVTQAVRESKEQFVEGKSYVGADTLFEMLKQKRPEVWA